MIFDDRIYGQAVADGMPAILSTFIVAQARHETADYTSNVFTSCNNCFGYKWVGQALATGPCTGSPEGDSYAKYDSIEKSTHEITGWIKRRQAEGKFPANLNTIVTPDQYATLLKQSGYYGDSLQTYLAGLLLALGKIGNTQGSAILLLFIAIAALIWRKKIFH